MLRLQGLVLGLQVGVAGLVPRPTIFKLAVEPGLHLGLFKEHLLPDFIDGFLVVYGHSICDASDLLPSLGQIPLDLLALELGVLQTPLDFCIYMAQLFGLLA